jgi:2,5-diamino-6-(ribosylamino)-4(3H)-pyrimidinone 5'-phosphate reductase
VPIERLIDRVESTSEPANLYTKLDLPTGGDERPYTVVNMVSTVDGKILIGPPGSTAQGLGSPTDQLLMRRIQDNVDGAVIGAGTLRTGNVVYRPEMWRAVVTKSGDVDESNRFFTDSPEKAIIFAPESLPSEKRDQLSKIATLEFAGADSVDVTEVAKRLRHKYGIEKLALEGGADLNYQFFEAGLVDEFFLTFAPKLKGGKHMPTPVAGDGFPARDYLAMELLSLYKDGDELYFRYRVGERKTA